jgi:hypothetical protein
MLAELPNQPQVILLEEHLRIIKEKDQKIHQLEKRLRFREELDAVPAEVMSQNQKAALYTAVKAIETTKPDEKGRVLLPNTDDIAKSAGQSPKTYQKSLTYNDKMIGSIRKETLAVRDDHGQIIYTETYVKPTERTFYPRLYEAEKARNHGGDRLTCRCGSERIKKKITYICMDCGEVHDEPPRFTSPEDQFGSPVNEHETEGNDSSPDLEATIVDSYLVPEDQFGSTVESDRKPNLTLLITTNYLEDQLDPTVEDESNNPPPSVSASLDHDSIIKDWLERRRGTGLIIYSTGSLKSSDKYFTKSEGYQPDLDAFITGDVAHIYGSRLRDPQTNTTQVLCFEIDQAEYNDQAQDYLLTLARAGAAAIYWQRQRSRGHLEIYFDRPVFPERARHWAYSVCPELEDIPECYPCQDKASNALSWPLYQRIGGTVYPCTAKYVLPEPHTGDLQECDPTDKEALAGVISVAVTPAALVEEYAKRADGQLAEQKCSKGIDNHHGGVIGHKPKPIASIGDNGLAARALTEFNRLHSWDWIAEQCGGWDRDKFCAVWRGDRSATVRPDRDEVRACDYGLHSPFPKKFDQYDAWCMLQAGHDWQAFKKADLADRCAELRRLRSQVADPVKVEEPAAALFPAEQMRGPVYAICPICSTPKTVQRADGVYTCGTDHSEEVCHD